MKTKIHIDRQFEFRTLEDSRQIRDRKLSKKDSTAQNRSTVSRRQLVALDKNGHPILETYTTKSGNEKTRYKTYTSLKKSRKAGTGKVSRIRGQVACKSEQTQFDGMSRRQQKKLAYIARCKNSKLGRGIL